MRRHSENALELARALTKIPGVARVYHPLLNGPNRILPHGSGGMMAFDVDGGREAVQRMIKRFELVTFAASLGGVETTISYPEITSHRSMSAEERANLGVGPGTIRVSAGLEDADDIIADFTQALR
jgi:cystathionine gamma-synthase